MGKLAVLGWEGGKRVGEATLDAAVFDGKVSRALIKEVVWSYGQNRRAFTASTKTRGQVSGGGKKPWKQKGTGRARTSSIRAPHWKGGGTVFGPHPKNIRYHLPKKVRLGALRSALNLAVEEKHVIIVDQLALREAKTKLLAQGLKQIGVGGKILVVTRERDPQLERAGRNLPGFGVRSARDVTAEDITAYRTCILIKDALEVLTQRLEKKGAGTRGKSN